MINNNNNNNNDDNNKGNKTSQPASQARWPRVPDGSPLFGSVDLDAICVCLLFNGSLPLFLSARLPLTRGPLARMIIIITITSIVMISMIIMILIIICISSINMNYYCHYHYYYAPLPPRSPGACLCKLRAPTPRDITDRCCFVVIVTHVCSAQPPYGR